MALLVAGSSLRVGLMPLVLGVKTTPLHAAENSNFITQKIESHSYMIPRDLVETIYKPNYSGVPNPNPNWPHEPVVRLALQWPEFIAPEIGNPQEKARRKINVTLLSGTVMTVAKTIERLNEFNYSPEIIGAPYGLRELRSSQSKEFREYIASPEEGSEYLIHCDQPEVETLPMLYYSCDYYFEYLDLKINVNFHSPFLSEWRKIHQKTLSLLNRMRKD
ncbi:hypothetical protein [Bradyrhizobium sp. OK095]|jgi:hypothetical protein|uniref:hypothetical protein n=1 Tax=Bradyrhizobium sp. OK095 TaxID=1882760 RepID=UPI0008B79C5C|nr:hypothetical protein [Bradyrhizobium sp. OK095]SEM75030.1 hypothetical protein SAMN05443254_103547 [Bradyrhizobium sp. OK095]